MQTTVASVSCRFFDLVIELLLLVFVGFGG
jgi:hypothetical protein